MLGRVSEWRRSWCFCSFSLSLGESIAANNAYQQHEGELSVGGGGVQEGGASSVKSCTPSSPSHQSIDSLIEKLQSGVQVCASLPAYSSSCLYSWPCPVRSCTADGKQYMCVCEHEATPRLLFPLEVTGADERRSHVRDHRRVRAEDLRPRCTFPY